MARALLIAIFALVAIACVLAEKRETVKKSEVSKNDAFVDDFDENDESMEKSDDNDEQKNKDDLDTADNIVFRPLFRYRKQRVEKKRVNTVPGTAAKPGPYKTPAPLLVYDPKTGSYYPVSSSYYSQFAASYPGYFGNNK